MSTSQRLAKLALDTESSGIPASARSAAASMLLDTFGCAIAGAHAPGVEPALTVARELGGAEQATVWFHGDRLPLTEATFVNSVMTHALDYDECFPSADLHILSIVVPAAFAVGEHLGRSGRETLDAVIIGVEVAGRIGKAYMRLRKRHRFFLTTSLTGGFGGVAAASRLMRLSVAETVNAFGICYAQASGNRLALLERKLTKRLQPGFAAKSAVTSVLLARAGITGPESVFEGPAGLFCAYTPDDDPDPGCVVAPGPAWGIEELWVKRFPTCGVHHRAIEAAIRLHHQHGLAASDIERVGVYLDEVGGYLVGIPFEPGPDPQIDAQFCAPYAVALGLLRGDAALARFSNAAVRADTEVADLARRTVIAEHWGAFRREPDPAKPPPGRQVVRVRLCDGRLLECGCTREDARSPGHLSPDEQEAKFRECLRDAGSRSEEQAARTLQAVRRFHRSESVADWIRHLPPVAMAES